MRPALGLDVLIPTHNRASLVERAAHSVLSACPVAGVDVQVVVICNACDDDTEARLARLHAAFPSRRLTIVHERRLGKSRALNAGIAATTAELVGMIDDDEEIDPNWISVAARAFTEDPSLDFVGGPYIPVWTVTPPEWIPGDYLAAIGSADGGPVPRAYGRDFPGILKGGNAIIRRRALEAVGGYAEYLGPGANSRLFSCEDEEMYLRLLGHGARGLYLPDLVIFHHVSPARLRRAYFRSWCFWRGVSRGLMDLRHPLPVTYLAGIPRFLYADAARGFIRTAGDRLLRRRSRLGDELKVWDLAGYLFGRHVYPLARFSPVKSRRRLPGPAAPARSADDVEDVGLRR
jgi:glycosyltransferase involved in cell wall biosynthesis